MNSYNNGSSLNEVPKGTDAPFLTSFESINNELERRAFIEKDASTEFITDTKNFLTDIRHSIFNAHEDSCEELIQYFRNWKLWLMHKHDYVYSSDLEFDVPEESSLEGQYFVEVHAPSYLAKYARAASDELEKILFLSNNDLETIHADSIMFDWQEDGSEQLIDACLKSRDQIVRAELAPAYGNLVEVCDRVRGDEHSTNLKSYLHSWALHMKGSVCQVVGDPMIAAVRFYESLRVKEKIHVPLIHTVQSYNRLAISLAHFDANRAVQMLESLSDHLVLDKSLSSTLAMQSKDHYHNLMADMYLARGNWRLVNENAKKAQELLLESYEQALSTDSKTRQLAAQVSLGVLGHRESEDAIHTLMRKTENDFILRNYSMRIARTRNIKILEKYNFDFAQKLKHAIDTAA